MLILAGRYLRDKALPPTCENCPRCRRTVQWNWRRMYKTAHFFFFPLFSFSETVVASCGFCGYASPARHPWPLPPLSFLDRLGFLVPVGGMAMAIAGFFVLIGVAVATAPPAAPPTAEAQELERIEQHLDLGRTWGEGPGAEGLAEEIATALVKDEGFDRQDLSVAVTTSATVPRRIFIDCEYMNLADLRPKARENLVRDLREVIDPKLHRGDHVVVAVKGVFLYGVLAHGSADADWNLNTGDVTHEEIEGAMREPSLPPAAVPVSSTTISSADLTLGGETAPSAAPSASAAPAPSASTATPPKKKKKKAKPVEAPKPEDPLP